jgi:hypothetical protein
VAPAGDTFCSSCGERLEGEQEGKDRPSLSARSAPLESRPTLKRSRLGIAAALIIAVALAASAVVLGLLWLTERSEREDAELALASSRQDATTLRSEKAKLARDLVEASSLSERRRAVLVRTQAVLKRVDPLLSSVDGLLVQTRNIQGARDQFSIATSGVVSDLLELANYLVDVDPAYVDYDYVNSLGDSINAQLDDVRFYDSTLDDYDGGFASASSEFESQANAYSKAVRALQRQLARVARR